MLGISFEHILIAGVVLLVLGPKRLPEIGSSMGKAIKNFKEGFSGISNADVTKMKALEAKTNDADHNLPSSAS